MFLLMDMRNRNVQVDVKGEFFYVLSRENEEMPPISSRYCFIGKNTFPRDLIGSPN